MPCSDCKHWRTDRNRAKIFRASDGKWLTQGVCKLLTEEHAVRANGQVLYPTQKTVGRIKKRRGLVSITTSWPEAILPELIIVTTTAQDFSCALYDKDKRRKVGTAPIPSGSPPRRYQLLLDESKGT
jgi:hypothetical protein